MNRRIETKVYGAVAGLASGGTLSAFVLWVLGVFVWGTPRSADYADTAISAVPWPVAAFVAGLLTAGLTFAGGYTAPRTTDAERAATTEPPSTPGEPDA